MTMFAAKIVRCRCAFQAVSVSSPQQQRWLSTPPKVKEYSLVAEGRRCLVRSTFPATGKELITDTPKITGGTDSGAQPVEHLLAALVGCKQATAHFVARKLWPKHLKLEGIDFNLVAWRDERGALEMPIDCTPSHPSRLQQVSGVATVHAAGCSEEDVLRLAEQVDQRCPVANMFVAAGTQMDIKWVAHHLAKNEMTANAAATGQGQIAAQVKPRP
jgi:uncharacterized OsmC-like protein